MGRETRIVVRPNASRWKRRQWYWAVQRRNTQIQLATDSVIAGIWYEVAHGYARNAPAAEQAAHLWLDEEALTERIQRAKMEAVVEHYKNIADNTIIINVEEN